VPPGFRGTVFKKGESGSEGRVKKSKGISEALKWRLRKQPKLAVALADVLLKQALDSKASGADRMKAMGMILERLEGAPGQALKSMEGVQPKHVLLRGDVPGGLAG
jgi:hypothetical protein